MGFEPLERQLRNFFRSLRPTIKSDARSTIRQRAMAAFVRQRPPKKSLWRRFLLLPRTNTLAFGAVAVFALFNTFPGGKTDLIAGEIRPNFGPIEVIREGEVLLLEKPAQVRVGDCVRVGNRAEAQIMLHEIASVARDHTEFCITDQNSLFLEKGFLANEGRGEIATERGIMKASPDATFTVSVAESGETKAVTQSHEISVFDSQYRKALLKAGQELYLRTDTLLSDQEIPENLRLSLRQINAIRARLIIARTKALTSAENFLMGKSSSASRDLLSAKQSFRSIVQVLDASRNLEIIKRRNLDLVELPKVHDRLARKTGRADLLNEARAVENLLTIVENHHGLFEFERSKSGSQSFDRYVLVDRVFDILSKKESLSERILKQKYIISTLQKVQGEVLKIDQISRLNSEISRLPRSPETNEFLLRLEEVLPADLAQILEEKRQTLF